MKTLPTLLIAFAIAFVLVPTGAASASAGALHVLIAYSDGAHTEDGIKSQIAAQPHVAVVDTMNAASTTPSLDTLDSYDVVVTFSNTVYADPGTLGDRLATYADMGGRVVEFGFDWNSRAQNRLGGRWASGGYSPYSPATETLNAGGTLASHDASSPLLAGVSSLGTDTHENPQPAPGAVEVARWRDGQSAAAFKGRAVGVNACVADGCDPFHGRLRANRDECAADRSGRSVVRAGYDMQGVVHAAADRRRYWKFV